MRGTDMAESLDEHTLSCFRIGITRLQRTIRMRLVQIVADDQRLRYQTPFLRTLVNPFQDWHLAKRILLQKPVRGISQIDVDFLVPSRIDPMKKYVTLRRRKALPTGSLWQPTPVVPVGQTDSIASRTIAVDSLSTVDIRSLKVEMRRVAEKHHRNKHSTWFQMLVAHGHTGKYDKGEKLWLSLNRYSSHLFCRRPFLFLLCSDRWEERIGPEHLLVTRWFDRGRHVNWERKLSLLLLDESQRVNEFILNQ